MKKNTKKQLNKKKVTSSKKTKNALLSAKKKVSKKIIKKTTSKTKASLKKNKKAVLRQKSKKSNIKRTSNKSQCQNNSVLTFGDVQTGRGKTLLLIIAIIFTLSIVAVQNMIRTEDVKFEQQAVPAIQEKRNVVLEREINDMVAGYPIERMTKFIAKQDPKVAAFMVAIAKKESAWGDKKPVLNGEDCFNYWGFRLKSDRMGSGGHTCFDSAEEAVSIVGARLNHLVNEEKIDTPKEMVIWKCGYSCDGPASAGSEKWIQDVDYYYKQMIN